MKIVQVILDNGVFILMLIAVIAVAYLNIKSTRISKGILKEYKQFSQITFQALRDRSLTVSSKEKVVKKWATTNPLSKSLLTKFTEQKGLDDDLKPIYSEIKKEFKSKKKVDKSTKK